MRKLPHVLWIQPAHVVAARGFVKWRGAQVLILVSKAATAARAHGMRHGPLGNEFPPCAERFTLPAPQTQREESSGRELVRCSTRKKASLRKHCEQWAGAGSSRPMRAAVGVGAYGFIRACPKGSTV
jgi:hypothetical protein